MSSFQRAREALGIRLRELRRDARLTGRQLAEHTGWHPSKVSKIEGGKQTPADADLEAWARACGQPGLAAELIASLRTLESHYVEHRRLFHAGMSPQQRAFGELEDQTAEVRNFENVFVPGLLQTPDYARYRLAEGIEYDGAPDDLDEAVGVRMQRQQILYRSDKRFHFVITEAVLRYRLCPVNVMLGQLDRLVTLSTMPTIRFGVIPFEASLPLAPVHGFWLMDERVVVVENFTASQNLTQASEVGSYVRIFDEFAKAARYESQARAIITRVLADLTALMA
ncbi:MAG TPA: helix-turn-helix transcriptional regulator [Streptosporangiaceae bacterium]|nr:helix-turn-helix transcriptional regulator [Streptosporangiaceae bacterium]